MSLLACGRWCGKVRFRGVDVEPLDVAVLRKLSCKTKITHETETSTELVDTKRGRFLKILGGGLSGLLRGRIIRPELNFFLFFELGGNLAQKPQIRGDFDQNRLGERKQS